MKSSKFKNVLQEQKSLSFYNHLTYNQDYKSFLSDRSHTVKFGCCIFIVVEEVLDKCHSDYDW